MISHSNRQKILFIYWGHFSGTNDEFLMQVESKFPEYEVVKFDVKTVFNRRSFRLTLMYLLLMFRYGRSSVNWSWVRRTKLASKYIRQIINEKVNGEDYIFTVQIQSLYDASTKDLPHFIYTDHTSQATLYYPDEDKAVSNFDKFLEHEKFLVLEKEIYNHATHVFTMSSHVSNSLIEHYDYDPKKVSLIGAGPNVSLNHANDLTKDYSKVIILFVGLDWERKGGPELLEAFKIVRQTIPSATLRIVGCSPQIDYSGVEIIGKVPQQEVQQFYEDASVFCMPSKREPFGIVFLEAMYNKLPIVGLNIGSLPDLVIEGQNGYTVPYGDIIQLANRLIELLQDPDKCDRFGQKSYQMLVNDWTWDSVGEKFKQSVLKVLSDNTI